MFSTVVFDFDGTLVDSNALKRKAFFDLVAGDEGGDALMHDVLDHVVGDRRAVLQAYVMRSPSRRECDVDSLVVAYGRRVDAAVTGAPEMPGASALLQTLRERGAQVHLSSATPLSSLEQIIAARGWLDRFDGVHGHPAVKVDTLRGLCGFDGHDASRVAVVGDGIDDRDSAAAVGCAFFPVGEARGRTEHERVFTLAELAERLIEPTLQFG